MPRPKTYRNKRAKKLTGAPAISDDEQSDVGGDIVVPLNNTRAKSRSAEYRDDVSEARSDVDIPTIKGDLNGDADNGAAASANDEGDEEEDDEDLEPDECVPCVG